MATAEKLTQKVPVTTFEEKTVGVTLTLSMEEAQELRNVISDIHVSSRFTGITAIRSALNFAGVCYRFGFVHGNLVDHSLR